MERIKGRPSNAAANQKCPSPEGKANFRSSASSLLAYGWIRPIEHPFKGVRRAQIPHTFRQKLFASKLKLAFQSPFKLGRLGS